MTCSSEHVSSLLHGSVCWVADHHCGLSTAWVAFSEVVVAIWVLTMALVVIPGVVVVGLATVVGVGGCDVAFARAGLAVKRGAGELSGVLLVNLAGNAVTLGL